jgi:hypothetical protein
VFFPNNFQQFLPRTQPTPITLLPPAASDAHDSWVAEALSRTADPDGTRSVEFLGALNAVLKDTPFELAFRALNELLLSIACFAQDNGDQDSASSDETQQSDSGDEEAGEAEAVNTEQASGNHSEDGDQNVPETTVTAPEPAELRLLAAWDDFVMQKVLPRVEGDAAKLRGNTGGPSNLPSEFGSGTVLNEVYDLLSQRLALIWGAETDDAYDGQPLAGTRPDLLRNVVDFVPCRSRHKLRWMLMRLKSDHFTNFWV